MRTVIEVDDRVVCKHPEWHCLCGVAGCMVTSGEKLTVSAREYFPGLGAMLQFKEKLHHPGSEDPPWFSASAFKLWYDA